MKFDSLVIGAASAAPLGVALFALLLGLDVAPVTSWFWPAPTTNLAEAAALGDAARVRWLATQGVHLDAPLPLQDDVRGSNTPPVLTPLEAAIRYGADDVGALLLELGARPSADEARRLHCLALPAAKRAATLLQNRFNIQPGSCPASSAALEATR